MKAPTRANVREQILDGARRAIAEHGVQNVTTRQIAAEAGVAIGTFYRHFASKAVALEALGWGHAAAIASLAAVRGLHRPITRWSAYEGDEGSYSSYQDLVDSFADEPDAPSEEAAYTFRICQECGRLEREAHEFDDVWAYTNSIWPCSTAEAIGDHDA